MNFRALTEWTDFLGFWDLGGLGRSGPRSENPKIPKIPKIPKSPHVHGRLPENPQNPEKPQKTPKMAFLPPYQRLIKCRKVENPKQVAGLLQKIGVLLSRKSILYADFSIFSWFFRIFTIFWLSGTFQQIHKKTVKISKNPECWDWHMLTMTKKNKRIESRI